MPEYINCEIVVIPGKCDLKPYAYGLQKNSPFLGIFNYYIKELKEKGAAKKIIESYESGAQVRVEVKEGQIEAC